MVLDTDIRLDCFTSTVVVCSTPCWLYAIIGVSSATTAKILTVRDGVLAAALARLILYCSVYNNPIAIFEAPIYFKNGLYLDFGLNVDAAMVQWKKE